MPLSSLHHYKNSKLKTGAKLAGVLLIFALLTTGCGLKPTEPLKNITLKYWRVWDDNDAFDALIKAYDASHPNIKIEYKKFRYNEYENELLNAFAEDRGPDIFSIHNTWVKKYQTKIQPLPPAITMTYPTLQGTIKKEVVPVTRTDKALSVKELENSFVDQVASDAVIQTYDETTKTAKKQIYGLPLYVDTLAMYYNKDLFNNAGIAEPAASWDKKFLQDVKKLTKQNTRGEIIQSGVALGGSSNIDRASDILSILMMQNGAVMMENGRVAFDQVPTSLARQGYNPGLNALIFYADFANPSKEVYAWNKELDNSLKMFAQNKLAILFGYSYHLPQIRAEAPKLNFAVTRLPQIKDSTQTVNFANYWLETVSKKSKNQNEAWDFIQFITRAENVTAYLDKAKKPTAIKALQEKQTEDPDIGVFAEQVLTAKSWYRGKDPIEAERIINQMIDDMVAGLSGADDIIGLGARRVQQTVE